MLEVSSLLEPCGSTLIGDETSSCMHDRIGDVSDDSSIKDVDNYIRNMSHMSFITQTLPNNLNLHLRSA